MDMNTVMTAVGTIGFPIVACCVMFWYLNKEREDHKNETESLTGVIADLRVTLEKNTTILERVVDKLGE